jgi:membrane-bound ClpP family serine protease
MSDPGLGLIGTAAALALLVIGALLAVTNAITWDTDTILGVFMILVAVALLFGSGVAAFWRRGARGPGTGV